MKIAAFLCLICIIVIGISNLAVSSEHSDSNADTIPPTVIISNKYEIAKPANGKSSIILTGTVMDNVGVVSMLWQTFNSQNNKLSSETGNIKYSVSPTATRSTPGIARWTSNPIPLFAGDNLLTIAASDEQNNLGIQSLHVLLQTINGKVVATVIKTSPDRIKGTVFYVPSSLYPKAAG